ncbi:MAG: tetratricopeptide repeat protein, partial [Candidatus Cyclobacteriaceae bacterium M2_1C_046]
DNSRDLNLEKQIDAYIKGHLSANEAEELWASLLLRPDYIELLETELYIKQIIEEELAEEKGRSKTAQPIEFFRDSLAHSWKWMAAAASIAILVIAINFFQAEKNQSIQELVLGEINMVENLASAEVKRSQEMKLPAVDSLLNLGFKAAISGNVDEALGFYKEVIENYNNTSNASMAYLNLGIIEYNAEKYKEASVAFSDAIQRIEDDRILKEKALWYLGNAFIKLDRLEEGREAILRAYSMDGIYRNPASRLLQRLDHELGITDSDFIKNK